MEYKISQKSYVLNFRVYIIFICCVILVLFQFIDIDNKYSYLIGILGLILTTSTFFEPLINPIVRILFKEIVIIKRIDIYHRIIREILTADQVIRFKTPTTTWGVYSEGLKVFEETIEAIQKAVSRGVEVKVIADIWDWERAKFAEALIKAGATLKYSETIHDYYMVKDETLVITMGTETKAQKVQLLDRNVRRLTETATLSIKPIHIRNAYLKFDDEWDRLDQDSASGIINKYLHIDCPHCHNSSRVVFEEGKVILKPHND